MRPRLHASVWESEWGTYERDRGFFLLRILFYYCVRACSVHSKKGWLLVVALSFRVCCLPIDRPLLAQNSLQGRRSWTFLAFQRSWHFWSGHKLIAYSCLSLFTMIFSLKLVLLSLWSSLVVWIWHKILFLAFRRPK